MIELNSIKLNLSDVIVKMQMRQSEFDDLYLRVWRVEVMENILGFDWVRDN